MSLTRLALGLAAPVPQVEAFDSYLFMGPHPDDIEVGAGTTVAKLTAAGKRVTFLICTDGRFGLDHAAPGTSPVELIAVRREEARRSAALLGVEDVRFLDFSDGGLYDPDALFRAMARVIGQVKPQVIFAPDPCVTSECHVDHLNVGEAARRLAFLAPHQALMASHGAESAPVEAIAFYMTARPNRYVATGEHRALQRRAILCHESQFPADSADFRAVDLYLRLRALSFGLRRLHLSAEGFRVLGRTQMHCLPEAGR